MIGSKYSLAIGLASAIAGGVLWWKQEEKQKLMSPAVFLAMGLIVFGAANIIIGHEHYVRSLKPKPSAVLSNAAINWRTYLFVLFLIFVGSVSYTIAAYYHLKLRDWTFVKAFALALPLILVEYQFSIRGNRAAQDVLKLNAVQITLITMAFYFINSWVLNHFFLKKPVVWWRELLAFGLIAAAFVVTTTATRS